MKFDLMLDSLGCRQTDAEWSFRYLAQHSHEKSLKTKREVTARIPERELLFALKLHSGRKADVRDLVVLAMDADFARVETHLRRGDPEKFRAQIETVVGRIESDGFADAFKGVFQQRAIPDESIENTVRFLRRLKSDL